MPTCNKCGATWMPRDSDQYEAHRAKCDGVRKGFDRRKNCPLRAHGFTDPESQVEEAVRLLRRFVGLGFNASGVAYDSTVRARKLLAELDAEKAKSAEGLPERECESCKRMMTTWVWCNEMVVCSNCERVMRENA